MLKSKTLKVAAGFCLMASTVCAQLPQLQMDQIHKVAPAKISVEQMKERFQTMKMKASQPNQTMKMNKQVSTRAMKPMNGIIPAQKKVMTRAGEFGAYYELPAGLYNEKSGFEYIEGTYSRHGILAPLYQDIVFKNASTGAVNFDWFVNDQLVMNEDSIEVMYVPGGDNYFFPMPELTAYSAVGTDSLYQYGYAWDYDKKVYTPGEALITGFGYVHNMDVGAESFLNSYIATMNERWTQMLFGYNETAKLDYFEIFEKPYHTVVLNSVFTYIATPVGHDISEKEFSVYAMVYDEASQGWKQLTKKISAKPAVMLGSLEECDVWQLQIFFEKPTLVSEQFALVFSGPQDGSTYWSFMHQNDRELTSGKVTAGYIPLEGEYAGYMNPYAITPQGSTEPVAYPASIDLGLQLFMPYNMAIDPETFNFVNYGGYTELDANGLNAPIILWNWEAYIMGDDASMEITSNVDWLRAEITKYAADTSFLYNVDIIVDPLPENVAGRRGVLTFTDGPGYKSTWTFVQGDAAAGIEQTPIAQPAIDPNAPIFDLMGRQVINPTKGIYMQNGKKFVVK